MTGAIMFGRQVQQWGTCATKVQWHTMLYWYGLIGLGC